VLCVQVLPLTLCCTRIDKVLRLKFFVISMMEACVLALKRIASQPTPLSTASKLQSSSDGNLTLHSTVSRTSPGAMA
jgi:uncharacterized membrane protein